MPRRKKLEEATPAAPAVETTTDNQETKNPRRRVKALVDQVVATVTKSRRSKPPVEAKEVAVTTAAISPVVDEPKPARGKRGKAEQPSAPPSAPAPEGPAKKQGSSNRRGKKSARVDSAAVPAVAASEPLDEDLSEIVIEFRSPQPRNGNVKRGDRKGPVMQVQPAPQPEAAPAPKKAAKRRLTAEDKALDKFVAECEIAPLEWRTRTPKPSQKPKVEAVPEEAPATPSGDRGRRGRRGRRPEAATPVAEAQVPVVEAPPEPPAPPVNPSIRIPADAPQVVVREGVPTLVRDGRVYPPIAFFGGSRDEQRARTVNDQIRMAGEAGVHIHTHLVELEVDELHVSTNVSTAAYLLKKTLEVDPEAQVLFRVVFAAAKGWQDRFPEAKFQTADGDTAEPSLCDDPFWDVARSCLVAFVEQLRLLPNRESILGVHLDRGEWFFVDGVGYDTSRAARNAFRDWARTRYRDDVVALRAAWFDGSVEFSRLEIPPYQQTDEGDKFVRANRKERRWVDYHLFLSDAAVSRIADLAYAAKQASEGYFLVGVSYGYTFEWSHPGSGHLSLGKLLRTEEIDYIAGPPSYRNREPGGSASFPCPVDSFALNGKLYLSEEDYKTSLGTGFDYDDFNPVIKTPQALESVHWRGVGASLAHGSGICWMDLWGNGWLKTSSVWERAKTVQQALIARMACPLADPDVAVFIDERSLAYLVDQKGFGLLVQSVRESVLRAGMSAGFYLLSDLQHRDNFPESRLYLFLDAWDIRPDLRAAIKQRLQKDDKVLFWLYSAGLFDSGRESLERAREVTGIALKPQPFHSRTGTTIVARRHPLADPFEDKSNVGGAPLEPSYFAIPEDGTVLGEYSQTGLPSFVYREFRPDSNPETHWRSVFLGEPIVTAGLLRALGQMAGAHVWSFTEDVVHVRAPFLTVHCTGAGPRTITLPGKWSAYSLNAREWVSQDSTSLRFTANDGSTHVFLVGEKEELELILNSDPTTLLRMDSLPEKHHDTIRFDASTFDVPIMKLDEWMEGGDGEDIADDLLFKARQLDETEPEDEQERVGRRRRRRGGRRDGGGSEEGANRRRVGESTYDEEVGMNIVFRKKE